MGPAPGGQASSASPAAAAWAVEAETQNKEEPRKEGSDFEWGHSFEKFCRVFLCGMILFSPSLQCCGAKQIRFIKKTMTGKNRTVLQICVKYFIYS